MTDAAEDPEFANHFSDQIRMTGVRPKPARFWFSGQLGIDSWPGTLSTNETTIWVNADDGSIAWTCEIANLRYIVETGEIFTIISRDAKPLRFSDRPSTVVASQFNESRWRGPIRRYSDLDWTQSVQKALDELQPAEQWRQFLRGDKLLKFTDDMSTTHGSWKIKAAFTALVALILIGAIVTIAALQ